MPLFFDDFEAKHKSSTVSLTSIVVLLTMSRACVRACARARARVCVCVCVLKHECKTIS